MPKFFPIQNFRPFPDPIPKFQASFPATILPEIIMNWILPKHWKLRYEQELREYRVQFEKGNFETSWKSLERAHLIGQYYPIPHTGVHFRMLLFAIKKKDQKEILGQLLRLGVGWFGSLLNRIPVGNTGGSNIPILQPMPLPSDLVDLLSEADQESRGLSGLKRKSKN